MITLGASQSVAGLATSATTVNYTISGLLLNTATPPVAQAYEVLAQGQLAAAAASLYTPGGSASAMISSVMLLNTSGSAVQTVKLYMNGTAGSNQIASLVLPTSGWATYEDAAGWSVYNSLGAPVGTTVVGKNLGQAEPASTVLTSLYVTPSTVLTTKAKTVIACNNSSTATDFIRISVAIAGAADTAAQYIFGGNGTNLGVVPGDTFYAQLDIELAPTDVIRCYSANGTSAFNLFGEEIS